MSLKIVNASAFTGPNIFAPVPVVGLVVDVGILSDRAPAGLDAAFFAELLKFLPELETNKSFVSGLREDPSLRLGHVIAGVAL